MVVGAISPSLVILVILSHSFLVPISKFQMSRKLRNEITWLRDRPPPEMKMGLVVRWRTV